MCVCDSVCEVRDDFWTHLGVKCLCECLSKSLSWCVRCSLREFLARGSALRLAALLHDVRRPLTSRGSLTRGRLLDFLHVSLQFEPVLLKPLLLFELLLVLESLLYPLSQDFEVPGRAGERKVGARRRLARVGGLWLLDLGKIDPLVTRPKC